MYSNGKITETIFPCFCTYDMRSGVIFPSLETILVRQREIGSCMLLSLYVWVQPLWFCAVVSWCVLDNLYSGILQKACLFVMRVLITLLRSLTWMRIYRRKALLSHSPLIMIFLDTLWPDRVPWQTLTEWSGCPPLFVKIPVYLCQRNVCLTSGIWLSCER